MLRATDEKQKVRKEVIPLPAQPARHQHSSLSSSCRAYAWLLLLLSVFPFLRPSQLLIRTECPDSVKSSFLFLFLFCLFKSFSYLLP